MKYYSILRPVSIGTYPKSGLVFFLNYDRRTFVPEIGREAWGELTYERELTQEEMKSYDLVACPENSESSE